MKITFTNDADGQQLKAEFTTQETLRLVPLLNQLTANAETLQGVMSELKETAGPLVQILTFYAVKPELLMDAAAAWSETPQGGIAIAKMMELWVEVQKYKGVYNDSQQPPQTEEEPDFQEMSLDEAFSQLSQFLSS